MGAESLLMDHAQWLMQQYGALGVLVAMFLESSIVPIPSEAVIVAAGYFGISRWAIVFWGAIGSTLGGCVGYAIGHSAMRRVLDSYGRWIGLTPARLDQVYRLAERHGAFGVLIGRLLPIIPFKVFSIAAGTTRISFWRFLLMTFVGVVPRLFLLSIVGEWLRHSTLPMVIGLLVIGGIYLWYQRFGRNLRLRRDQP